MKAWLGGLILATVALAACHRADDSLVTHRLLVMATWVDVLLPQSATRRNPDLIQSIEAGLRQFEADFYAWGDGELAELNRTLSSGRSFDASEPMARLLASAREVAAASDNAFDPGVGRLVELWGFQTSEAVSEPPDAAAIRQQLSGTGAISDLTIDGSRIGIAADRAGRDNLQFRLDLGGIAKGAAIDWVVEQIHAADVSLALVNAGGDLRVIGKPVDRDWRIGIAAPRGPDLLGTLRLLDGEAAFTSGDYERFYEHEGERFHHILDPRTGLPVSHTQAVTVIAANGTTADAAATALFVAGADAWRDMAASLGIAAVLRVDASGAIEMTPLMRERLQPSADIGSDIIAAD